MDIRRLEVFLKVIELRSFTKAAEALNLSQPTVSEHIRCLEESLSERLVDRLGREVGPTPAGKVFGQYARQIVKTYVDAIQALEQFNGKMSGTLLVGASSVPGAYVLPKYLGAFKSNNPAVQIMLRISATSEIIDQVIEGSLEVGFVGSSRNDKKLVFTEVCLDELVPVMAPEHPWAGLKSIGLHELEGEPVVLRQKGSGTLAVAMRILSENGFDVSKLNVAAEMGDAEAVKQGVKSGIGISFMSVHAVSYELLTGSLATTTIRGVRFVRPLYTVSRRHRQICPLCQSFLKFLEDELGKLKISPKITGGYRESCPIT
jgi:DNA-binding transcriptional LysR family regulator